MRSQILFCIVITILSITLVSCDEIRRTVTHQTRETENMEKALSFFVEDNQIMTKRDALAKEIDYYQDPTILRQEFIGNLSGKSLIHIANEIQKED